MKRGDVVLVDWPFSDRTGSKLCTAVVVRADFLNGLFTLLHSGSFEQEGEYAEDRTEES